jgi:hypothetical protein
MKYWNGKVFVKPEAIIYDLGKERVFRSQIASLERVWNSTSEFCNEITV